MWYDSREGSSDLAKRLPVNGWLFPCFVCGTVTGKFTMLLHRGHLKVYRCPRCKNREVNVRKIKRRFIMNVDKD